MVMLTGAVNLRRRSSARMASRTSRIFRFPMVAKYYPLPGRGPVFISGAGLVDVERLLRTPSRPLARSLAEQVETEDAYARAYCDFVLGEVICVDDEQSLRKHRAAITETVMVYRNHVARQTARD